jgi:hypothetical protein
MKGESIMSQYLVVLYNNTNELIEFVNKEDKGNTVRLKPDEMFRTKVHFNIPDNSDPSKHFPDHHMEVRDKDETALFSFWGDDHNNYDLMYCLGTYNDKSKVQFMPGYFNACHYPNFVEY